MFKKTIATTSVITVLSFAMAIPALAQTNGGGTGCGFFTNLFGLCSNVSVETQSANALDSEHTSGLREKERFSSTTRETKGLNGTISATTIACVSSAVAVREASLDAGMATFSQAINSAYSTRATDLATAYAQTTATAVRAGIKTAWKTFNTSTKNAQRAWRKTQEGAWSAFRTALKACKATGTTLSDSANSVTEMSGE